MVRTWRSITIAVVVPRVLNFDCGLESIRPLDNGRCMGTKTTKLEIKDCNDNCSLEYFYK